MPCGSELVTESLIKMAEGQVNEKLLKRTRTEFVELVKRKKGNLTTEFQV